MISELVEMLGFCRPAATSTEESFITKYLEPLGVMRDNYGNVIKLVGDDDPIVMWSSHTDTVHRTQGRVPVLIEGNIAKVNPATSASCLGADCTTGVWIMMQMIRAQVPGLYVFHRAEEIGCKGSEYLLNSAPSLFDNIQACIAFDRYGTDSVITHQMMERTCSEAFAQSIIAQLPGYQPDDGGSYTDSYTYRQTIPECTNLSVGYYNQHGKNETQNLSFAQQLADWMCNFDVNQLVIERDPRFVETSPMSRWRGGDWSLSDWDYNPPSVASRRHRESLPDLVRDNPDAAADMLEFLGITANEFQDFLVQSGDYALVH